MAIEEHDREDLLREGRMMPLRGECSIDGVTIVAGFRQQGQMSLYCGADPVFQFNAERQLRRVFFRGARFASENGNLIELTRPSRGGQVQLVSIPHDAEMQTIILSSLRDWLQKLHDTTLSGANDWRVIGSDADTFRAQLLDWLRQINENVEIATSPHV